MRRSVVQYCQTGRKDESETMKLMFASDLHGSAVYVAQLLERMREEEPERLILLGDLLYHGPRNDLPAGYDTKQVAAMLNGIGDRLLCVRGNCEAEVDQMVLDFPVLADYAVLFLEGRMVFLTHGHVFNEQNLPKLGKGDVLIHGHTHVRVAADRGDYFFLNPGSVSISKGDGIRGYMVYEDGLSTQKDLDGVPLAALDIRHG